MREPSEDTTSLSLLYWTRPRAATSSYQN
jgi:hypothetical protein